MFHGDRLAMQRKEKKMTQEELARKVRLTKAAISNYENGHSTPSHEILVSLADVLNIDTDYLLGRTETPNLFEKINDIGIQEQLKLKALINDPEHGSFIKEYLDAPEERKKQLMIVWRILKDAEKGRTLGDRQGE